MVLRAAFSILASWRSFLPNHNKRRHGPDTRQSGSIISPVPPSRSMYNANGEKIYTTHSNSSTRRDRNPSRRTRTPSPAPPAHSRQLHNQSDSHHDNNTRIRSLPLISSIFVPFSILLAIPGLTGHWYIRTNSHHEIVEFQSDPRYVRIMLGFGIAFAVITNLCLLVRLFEKYVKLVSILSIILLTLHDILDISVLIIFVIKTQVDDGFSLGQAFWTTLCSTFASFLVNITLVLDYFMSSEAERHVSGLTKKQRELAIMIIALLGYIAFGAAVHMSLISLTYINALYFTVVCIETIGFGDISPQTPGARVFTSVYTVLGIVLIAITIGLIHESLSEAIRNNFYARLRRKWKKRVKDRWEAALKWRLEQAGLPVCVVVDANEEEREEEEEEEEAQEEERRINGSLRRFWWRSVRAIRVHICRRLNQLKLRRNPNWRHMELNLRALSDAQLQAAAMEAGAPLKDLLPRRFRDQAGHPLFEHIGNGQAANTAPTHYRMGMMINLLGSFAYALSMGQPHGSPRREESNTGQHDNNGVDAEDTSGTGGLIMTLDELKLEEKRYFIVRIIAALTIFLTFWLAGSAVFSATEGWTYTLSLYFCFVTFSTVGYGDPVPKTPAGRSIFVGWALCGVGTMTILISLLADRYTEGYKDIIISSAAHASITEEKKDDNNVTTSEIMQNTETVVVDYSDPSMSGLGQGDDGVIFGNRELLSRVDTLKGLIVEEGAVKEGKLLHTIESELQHMLSHIRRARTKLFTETIEE